MTTKDRSKGEVLLRKKNNNQKHLTPQNALSKSPTQLGYQSVRARVWDLLRVVRELTSLGGHTAEQYIINLLEITILKCELSQLPRLLCKNIKGAFAKTPSLPQILQTSEG